jgi:hypothetical protein
MEEIVTVSPEMVVVLNETGKVTPDLSVSISVYMVTVLPSITEVIAVTDSVIPVLSVTVVIHSKVETPSDQRVVPSLVWVNDESVEGIVITDPLLRVVVLSVTVKVYHSESNESYDEVVVVHSITVEPSMVTVETPEGEVVLNDGSEDDMVPVMVMSELSVQVKVLNDSVVRVSLESTTIEVHSS